MHLPSLQYFKPEFMSLQKPHPLWTTDLVKVVNSGILDPRKYLCCKKVFSPNPAFLLTIQFLPRIPYYQNYEGRIQNFLRKDFVYKIFFEKALHTKFSLKGHCINFFVERVLYTKIFMKEIFFERTLNTKSSLKSFIYKIPNFSLGRFPKVGEKQKMQKERKNKKKIVCYGLVRFGTVWYGLLWFAMVCYGLLWFAMV